MISKQEVQHIAKLARLGLTEKEIKKYEKELSKILDYFDLLKKVDISKVEPCFYPNEQESGFLKKDETKPQSSETADKLVEAAPQKKGRHIKVKAVL